jgi:hypothetical protein
VKPVVGQPGVECLVGEAGLNTGDKVVRSDLQNAIHHGQVEADASPDGQGMGLQAAPLPERHDGHPILVGEAQDLHDLVAILGVDHGLGPHGCVVGKDAAGVPLEVIAPGDDAALRQGCGELRERVHLLLRLDRVGEGA